MTENDTLEMTHMPDDAVDHAEAAVFVETRDDSYPMVTYPNRDYTDVPGLVHDRIEASGLFPNHFPLPEPGEKKTFGNVAWDENGYPLRVECVNGVVVTFEDDGVPAIHPEGDD